MAKKKRSAALFEVMVKQEQRRLARPPGMFRTLVLWFKNRPKAAPVPVISSVAVREEAAEPVITQPPPAPILREVEYVPPPPEPEMVVSGDDSQRMVAVQRHVSQFVHRFAIGQFELRFLPHPPIGMLEQRGQLLQRKFRPISRQQLLHF